MNKTLMVVHSEGGEIFRDVPDATLSGIHVESDLHACKEGLFVLRKSILTAL